MTTDRQIRKETYAAPSLEVIKMENEGIIAASGNTESYSPTQMSSTRVNSSYNSASSSDLEDLINDLFTVEN